MEEAEWLTSDDPQEMLTCFQNMLGLKAQFPRPSDRKLRLFGVACCRRVWHLFGEPGRRTVEVAERHADDQATLTEVMTACKTAIDTAGWVDPSDAAGRRPYSAASRNMFLAVWPVSHPDILPRDTLAFIHNAVPGSANLLREIVGNPFQPAIPIWELMSWRTPTVLALAQAAYEVRRDGGTLDPDRLAVLADALEEAGYTNADLMRHLRFGQTVWDDALSGYRITCAQHYRGCWALDTILGKE